VNIPQDTSYFDLPDLDDLIGSDMESSHFFETDLLNSAFFDAYMPPVEE